MSKDVSILILGLLTAAMPYLGFPANYERIIFVVIGLSVAALAFLIRGDISLFSIERKADTFVENNPKEDVMGEGNTMTEEGGVEHEEERKEERE